MNAEFFAELYDYTFWADRKFFECVMALSEAQFRQHVDFSQGAVAQHVIHIMMVEYWWIHFLATGELEFIGNELESMSRDELRAKWDEVERGVRAYIATLTPAELARTVKPEFWDAEYPPITVAQALMQVVAHSMDHRVQAMAIMHTQFDGPTFGQDFLSYLHRNVG